MLLLKDICCTISSHGHVKKTTQKPCLDLQLVGGIDERSARHSKCRGKTWKPAASFLENNLKQVPGCTRPALPLRCAAAAEDTHVSSRQDRSLAGSYLHAIWP